MSLPTFSVWADGTLTWDEFLSRIALPQLPPNFPLPSGDCRVRVAGSFNEAGEFLLSCSLDLKLADGVELAGLRLGRECRFSFRATTTSATLSGGGTIAGEVFLEADVLLPDLPELPGVMELHTGDTSGWVRIRFHARADTGGTAQLSAEIMKPLALRLQLPGMPQSEPPVQAVLDQIALEFVASSSSGTVKLELLGRFELHPFIPPVQLPVSPYLTPLFATLPVVSGSCRLTVGMRADKPELEFDATFDTAEIDIDILAMLRDLAAGLSNPPGSATEVPLEIDFGFRLIGLSFALGGEPPVTGNNPVPFTVTLKAQVTLGEVEAVGSMTINSQEFSFGLDRMVIPLTIPSFPITQSEFTKLYADPAWHQTLDGRISALEFATSRTELRLRSRLQIQKLLLMAVCTLRGDYHNATGYHMQGPSLTAYGEWLALIFGALDQATSVVAGGEAENRYQINALTIEQVRDEFTEKLMLEELQKITDLYTSEAAFVAALAAKLSPGQMAMYEASILKFALIRGASLTATIGDEKYHICDDLSIVLRDVKFRIPSQTPRDIGVRGSAQFSGFVGPSAFLNDAQLEVGLSADLIYVTLKSIDGTIDIPTKEGRYSGGSINFSEFRFGFGYTKRSLAIALAGGVVLPRQLVDDLDSSDITVAGIRLPVQTRLSFRFELIPVPVIKVMPLFQFNLDLRQNYSPGLADSRLCLPYWDGLQFIVPGVIHVALKHLAFSPLFAILPALNWAFDGDLVLGDDHNGFSFIIDDLLLVDALITGTMAKIPLPGLADDSPFCENLCMSLRVAGFAANFNLQRPFPSFSPLALFELLALLSDPEYFKIDPRGDLANSLRVTLKDVYVVLPENLRHYFPGSEAVDRRSLNITINLADYIGVAQKVAAIAKPIVMAVIDAVRQGANEAQNIPARLEQCRNELATPDWKRAWQQVLTRLPAEVRTFSQHASFAGFSADSTVVLMTRDEALAELNRRNKTPRKKHGFRSLRPGRPLSPEAFRTFCFTLPVVGGASAVHDRDAPANNAFAGPAFTGLTTLLLKELLPTADEMVVIVAARVQVVTAVNQFVGYLSNSGAFKLVTTSEIEPFQVSVAGLSVAVPLQFHGRMELAGDARGGSVKVSVDAVWDVVPGVLTLTLGTPRRPLLLRNGSDGRFMLNGSAEANLFNGLCSLKGTVTVTESYCLIDDAMFRYSLAKLVKVEARLQGQVGPHGHFAFDGDGALTIFGKSFGATFTMNEHRLEMETRLLLSKWRLPDGKSIPCALEMNLQGGIDFSRAVPTFALAGEGSLEVFGASISGGRGGVRYQDGHLSVFAEGVLSWHGHEWLSARIEVGPDWALIQGRVSLPLEIKPPGLAMGMVMMLNISARLKLNLATGALLDMEAHGDWLLGISLPNTADGKPHILPLACNRLPDLNAPQLPYCLIQIDGFPVPKIKDFDLNIPVPILVPGIPQKVKFPESVTLPSLDEWHGKLTIDLNYNPLEINIPTTPTLGWNHDAPNFSLPFECLPGFSLWLIWNPAGKRFELSSEAKISSLEIKTVCGSSGSGIAEECVLITNTAGYAVDIAGWRLHDAADFTHAYTLPPYILPSGATVRIWTKAGVNDETNLYWGLKHAVWNNTGDTTVVTDVRDREVARYTYRRGGGG